MSNLRVLVLSHMYPSSTNEIYGIFVHQQVLEIKKQNCEAIVISPVPKAFFPFNLFKSRWRQYEKLEKNNLIEGVKVYYPRYIIFPRLILYHYSGFLMYWGISKLIKKIRLDYEFDLIHAHVALPDGFAGLLLQEAYDKPLVVTIHGIDLYDTIHRSKKCFTAVEKVFAEAARVISVSSKLKEIAEDYFLPVDNVKVIGNGVATNDLYDCKNGNEDKETLKNKRKISILSVSELIKRKGQELNIKAIARLKSKYPDLVLNIIGDGPEKKNLENLSSDLGLSSNVVFFGRLPHHEVIQQMRLTDIFSLPSWNESFGVVYIEAMACGKPVIACQGEGIEDVIEDGVNGVLVKPKDVDDLTNKIEMLIVEPAKANKIGERARKLVLDKYTWKENARKTVTLYKEVLEDAKT